MLLNFGDQEEVLLGHVQLQAASQTFGFVRSLVNLEESQLFFHKLIPGFQSVIWQLLYKCPKVIKEAM